MTWGKSILAACVLAASLQGGLLAGEADGTYRDTGLTSLRNNAAVHIGGEVRVDYSYRTSRNTPTSTPNTGKPQDAKIGDLAINGANLRVSVDAHPNVQAFLKLDLTSNVEVNGTRDEILEEAMLVMSAVGGGGLGFFAGKGRAPYGQDVTLGMLQSYHHIADQDDSSEGRILVTDSVDDVPPGGGTVAKALPPMRPGQFDRTFMAGASYEWQDRWKVELAAFKPNLNKYEKRFKDAERKDNDVAASSIGAAARVWWRPVEDLTLEASAILVRSHKMARVEKRIDVAPGAKGTDVAKAVSVGADYRRGPWRVWGEYQHGWDWNFTKGYSTDTWQVGAARDIGAGVTVAAAVEGLHIDNDAPAVRIKRDYQRVAFSAKKSFDNGFFVMAEYGREWRRRHVAGKLMDKARGNFFGVRVGFSF